MKTSGLKSAFNTSPLAAGCFIGVLSIVKKSRASGTKREKSDSSGVSAGLAQNPSIVALQVVVFWGSWRGSKRFYESKKF
ncbi:hypothetical protein [Nitrosomonas sp. wSCUT-2]